MADAVAEYTEADIAVVNGGGIRASLYQGDVLGADLPRSAPTPTPSSWWRPGAALSWRC